MVTLYVAPSHSTSLCCLVVCISDGAVVFSTVGGGTMMSFFCSFSLHDEQNIAATVIMYSMVLIILCLSMSFCLMG